MTTPYVPYQKPAGLPKKPSLTPTDPYAFGGSAFNPTLTNMYATGQMGSDMGKGSMSLGSPTAQMPAPGMLPTMPGSAPNSATPAPTGAMPTVSTMTKPSTAGIPTFSSLTPSPSGNNFATTGQAGGYTTGDQWSQNANSLGVLPMGSLGTPQASGGAAPSGMGTPTGMAMPALPGMGSAIPTGFNLGGGSMNNMLAMATGEGGMQGVGQTGQHLVPDFSDMGQPGVPKSPPLAGGLIGNGNEMSQWSQGYQGSGGKVKAAQDEAANGGGGVSPLDDAYDIEQEIYDNAPDPPGTFDSDSVGKLPPGTDPTKSPTGVDYTGLTGPAPPGTGQGTIGGGSVGGVTGYGGNSGGTGIAPNPNSGIPMGPGTGYNGGGSNGNLWNPYIGYNPNNQVPGTSYTGPNQNPSQPNIGINLPYNPTNFGGGNQTPQQPRTPTGGGGSSNSSSGYGYSMSDSLRNDYGYSKPTHTFDPQNAEQYVANIGREQIPSDLRYGSLMGRDPLAGLQNANVGREQAPEREYTQQMAREAANEANALLAQGLNTRMDANAGAMGARGMGAGGAAGRLNDLARKDTLGQQASNIRQAIEGAAKYGDDFNRDIFGKQIEQRGQDTAFLSQLNDAINQRSALGVQQRGQDVQFADSINKGLLDLSGQRLEQRGQDVDQQKTIASIVNSLLGQTNKEDMSKATQDSQSEWWNQSSGSGGGGGYASSMPDQSPYGKLDYLNPMFWY